MRRVCIFIIIVLSNILTAKAEDASTKEKVVTNKWSLVFGDVTFTNHYLTNHEYTGIAMGVKGEHGAFYKKSENLSWDFDLTLLCAPYSDAVPEMALSNPAGTSYIGMYNIMTEYGTHYNWNPKDRLYLKAGASFDVLFGFYIGKPNSINNAVSVDLQTQLKASAGIKYGWNLKKSSFNLFGDLSFPFLGLMMVDSRYQGAMHDNNVFSTVDKHMLLSSLHNLHGYDMELGVELVFKKTALTISYEEFNRWWSSYELQNTRMYGMFKIGLSVDLISRSRIGSKNRYF